MNRKVSHFINRTQRQQGRERRYAASVGKVNIEENECLVVGHDNSPLFIKLSDTKRIFCIDGKTFFAVSDDTRPTLLYAALEMPKMTRNRLHDSNRHPAN
jgi:hypothetical protein